MNEKFTDQNRDEQIAQKLNQVAEQTHANSQFAAELEERLRDAHRPKSSGWFTAVFRQVSPAVRWVALMVLLGLGLSLSIKTLIPSPQPGSEGIPLSQDATDIPTGTVLSLSEYTVRAGDTCAGIGASFGVSIQSLITQNNLSPDCVISVGQVLKIPYPTPTPADPNTTPVPSGKTFDYGGSQIIMNVPFPDAPAQVNAYSAFRAQPATAEYARALAAQFGIEGKVYKDADLGWTPERSPLMVTDGKQQLMIYAENNYTYAADLVKYARAHTTFVHANGEAIIREFMQTHGVEFDFRVEVEEGSYPSYILRQLAPDGLPMESDTQGSTRVTLDEDGNVFSASISIIAYDPASLGNLEVRPAEEALTLMAGGTFPIGSTGSSGSAPDPNLEPPRHWYYEYPDNQTVTVYGNVVVYPAVDPNLSAMVFIDQVPIIGNTNGMEALDSYSFTQATGQFVTENGIRKLNVETWDQDIQRICTTGSAQRAGDQIIVTDEGETTSEYALVDPPADLPLDIAFPDKQLVSCGVIIDEQLHWTDITLYDDPSQMGGGGGGGGGIFYELNLSGTPVPFPTATPTQPSIYTPEELSIFPAYIVQEGDTCGGLAASFGVSVQSIVDTNNLSATCILSVGDILTIPTTRLDGERGLVRVQIYERPDGRQRTSYTFITENSQSYYELKGDDLEPLQKIANHPINIWGDLSAGENGGMAVLTMEKFEPIYRDLQFQVLTGTQETKEIDGEQATLFTTGDTTYIQLDPSGGYLDFNYYPGGGEVLLEVLQIPDETYAGYPALRVFVMAPAVNPATGQPMELPRRADTIEVMPDPFGDADSLVPPDTFIEKIELIYFVTDPTYYDDTLDPEQVKLYLQPVWHYYGHNEHGDEEHTYIQALRQEYLLPQTEP
jgi:LysM repeat protein